MWKQYTFSLQDTAVPGAVDAIARESTAMDVVWTMPDGRLRWGTLIEPQAFTQFDLQPAGSAAGRPALCSRRHNEVDVYWVAPDGTVKFQLIRDRNPGAVETITFAGMAVPGTLAVTSLHPDHRLVVWVNRAGALDCAWSSGQGAWATGQLQPEGAAATARPVFLHRLPETVELFWATPDGGLNHQWWYENVGAWKQGQLAPAGSVVPGTVSAISTIGGHMDVFWVTPDMQQGWAAWRPDVSWRFGYVGDKAPTQAKFGADPGYVVTEPEVPTPTRGLPESIGPTIGATAPSNMPNLGRIPGLISASKSKDLGTEVVATELSPSTWSKVSTVLPSSQAPMLVSRGAGWLDLFHRNVAGSLVHRMWRNGVGWTRQPVPEVVFDHTGAAVSRRSSTIEMWMTKEDGSLTDLYWYDPPPPPAPPREHHFKQLFTTKGLHSLGGTVELSINSAGHYRMSVESRNTGHVTYNIAITGVLQASEPLAIVYQGEVGPRQTTREVVQGYSQHLRDHYDELASSEFKISKEYDAPLVTSLLDVAMGIVGMAASPIAMTVGAVCMAERSIEALFSGDAEFILSAGGAAVVFPLTGNALITLALEIPQAFLKQRELSHREWDWACEQVFGASLPSRQNIKVTTLGGASGRAFVFATHNGNYMMHVGTEGFEDLLAWAPKNRVPGEAFIHELMHVWQAKRSLPEEFLAAGVGEQCTNFLSNAYTYDRTRADRLFSEYTNEQQASIISDWWSGRSGRGPADVNSSFYRYVQRVRNG